MAQMQASSESEPNTSTFKYGYEDSDVIQHATAGEKKRYENEEY